MRRSVVLVIVFVLVGGCSLPEGFWNRSVEAEFYGAYMMHPAYGVFGVGVGSYKRSPGEQEAELKELKAKYHLALQALRTLLENREGSGVRGEGQSPDTLRFTPNECKASCL